jgi:hypothetical protein
MSVRWYLLKSPYDQVSGFESEALEDFGQEGFNEALDSSFGIDVDLYTNDMSTCTPIRAVIQRNVTDTRLNALHRHMLVPIGTCKTGMYVKYKNRFWLITGLVDDNGIYEKAVLTICNTLLSWINDRGDIVQRWGCINSASQYNNGLSYHKYYDLRSDQLLVDLSDDDECVSLSDGKRFIIDRRTDIYEKSFDATVSVETSKSVITYRITRISTTLYDYNDSGNVVLLLTQDEQHECDGYYKIDDVGYWLCPYPGQETQATTEEPESGDEEAVAATAEIQYTSDEIYVGFAPECFTAVFRDENGNVIDNITPSWEIDCDFQDLLIIDYRENSICISVDDLTLLNKSFGLSLVNDGYEPQTLQVTITSL